MARKVTLIHVRDSHDHNRVGILVLASGSLIADNTILINEVKANRQGTEWAKAWRLDKRGHRMGHATLVVRNGNFSTGQRWIVEKVEKTEEADAK